MGVSDKLRLESREMLQQERRQVTIFTKMEQVFHVQRIHAIFGIVGDELVRDEKRLVGVGRAQSVESETTGQTGD